MKEGSCSSTGFAPVDCEAAVKWRRIQKNMALISVLIAAAAAAAAACLLGLAVCFVFLNFQLFVKLIFCNVLSVGTLRLS